MSANSGSCENASTRLNNSSDGKAWEHFFLGEQYRFSNQIPNLESYTRTEPGWVLFDNQMCLWQGQPPQRMRQDLPVVTAAETVSNPTPTTANLSPTEGSFGIIVLIAAAAAGVWAWAHKNSQQDPDYHPHSDFDVSLPSLGRQSTAANQSDSLPDEIEWNEGDPIPDGFVLVDDGEDEGEDSPKFEPSPFIPVALKEQIKAEVEAVTSQETTKAYLAGMGAFERVYPRSYAPALALTPSVATATQPAVEPVGQPVIQSVGQPVEPDPNEVALFEELVEPFCPLALDIENGTTLEAVREAIRLGKSQNWIVAQLFRVPKGTANYQSAVQIIKSIKGV